MSNLRVGEAAGPTIGVMDDRHLEGTFSHDPGQCVENRDPTESNAVRADDLVAAVENLCILRAKDAERSRSRVPASPLIAGPVDAGLQ